MERCVYSLSIKSIIIIKLYLKRVKTWLPKANLTQALYQITASNSNFSNPCHAMDCKKGGFVHVRHDDLRKLETVLLSEVC